MGDPVRTVYGAEPYECEACAEIAAYLSPGETIECPCCRNTLERSRPEALPASPAPPRKPGLPALLRDCGLIAGVAPTLAARGVDYNRTPRGPAPDEDPDRERARQAQRRRALELVGRLERLRAVASADCRPFALLGALARVAGFEAELRAAAEADRPVEPCAPPAPIPTTARVAAVIGYLVEHMGEERHRGAAASSLPRLVGLAFADPDARAKWDPPSPPAVAANAPLEKREAYALAVKARRAAVTLGKVGAERHGTELLALALAAWFADGA
jgi:hypothetical protein